MKTVEFQGMMLEVPDWARWIAQEACGAIYAFETKPKKICEGWDYIGGRAVIIIRTNAPCILREIK